MILFPLFVEKCIFSLYSDSSFETVITDPASYIQCTKSHVYFLSLGLLAKESAQARAST
jgi:hypothetical protein